MSVDTNQRFSNEAERANLDIYDDFKLKERFGLHGLYKKRLLTRGAKPSVGIMG